MGYFQFRGGVFAFVRSRFELIYTRMDSLDVNIHAIASPEIGLVATDTDVAKLLFAIHPLSLSRAERSSLLDAYFFIFFIYSFFFLQRVILTPAIVSFVHLFDVPFSLMKCPMFERASR